MHFYISNKIIAEKIIQYRTAVFSLQKDIFYIKICRKFSGRVVYSLPMFQQRNALKYNDLQVNLVSDPYPCIILVPELRTTCGHAIPFCVSKQ